MRDPRHAKISATLADQCDSSVREFQEKQAARIEAASVICDECGDKATEYVQSASGSITCAKCEQWWKGNPPPADPASLSPLKIIAIIGLGVVSFAAMFMAWALGRSVGAW